MNGCDLHPDLSLTEKLELFHGMVRGVAFLHDHGVIHRDLKPANVIVDSQGVAKIVDFGLARLHQEGAATGMDGGSIGVSGTLHFMAPEQAANTNGSRAMPVDVYALGLMLHRILTGEWLRSTEGTPAETLALVLKPPPLVLHGPGRNLPRDLQSILRQALAPDPARRYHHARDLEADLNRFSAKQPVAARKHTVVYLTTTFLRRQARRSALAGAMVLAGLLAGGVLLHRHRVVAERNEANLGNAYALTSFTLTQLRDELRNAIPDDERDQLTVLGNLRGTAGKAVPELPVNAAGELDLRYFQAQLADLRSAASESHSRYTSALKSIQPALDLYSKLAQESPDDPERLLDAAKARLSFARLLGRVSRYHAAGNEARKTLQQLDRLAAWPDFDSADLPSLRWDAMKLLAQQAHHAGDSAGAVKIIEEIMAAWDNSLDGPLVGSNDESLSRLSSAASHLATYAAAAGPSWLPRARLKVSHATQICRAAFDKEPASFARACILARCLHATATVSLNDGSPEDLRVLFDEAANLLIDTPSGSKRPSLPLAWKISVSATDWAATLQDHPDPAVALSALGHRTKPHLPHPPLRGHAGRSDAATSADLSLPKPPELPEPGPTVGRAQRCPGHRNPAPPRPARAGQHPARPADRGDAAPGARPRRCAGNRLDRGLRPPLGRPPDSTRGKGGGTDTRSTAGTCFIQTRQGHPVISSLIVPERNRVHARFTG